MKIPTLAVALAMCAAASAHDFWIKPSTFRAEPGAVVSFDLRVGDDYPGESFPRSSQKIEKFAAFGPGGERPVVGREGAAPAGLLKVAGEGVWAVAYDSVPSSVEIEAEKFEQYLKDKGLEKIVARRAERGEAGAPATELFSRCAKTLIAVGGAGDAGFDRVTGMRLELIAESNPFALEGGEDFIARLEFDGQPLEGALVIATPLAEPSQGASGRTDASGRVRMTLPRGGAWVLNAVEMVDAPEQSAARWESFWASLSFEIAAGTAAPAPEDRR